MSIDRIKLAQTIGWKWQSTPESHPFDGWDGGQWTNPNGNTLPSVVGCKVAPPFDPLTDANDDYAVLEWLRAKDCEWTAWADVLPEIFDYETGDYARAALKVI